MWLDPIEFEKPGRFKQHELKKMRKIIEEHQATLLEAWHDFFG